jgi:hypothetical protein
MPDIIEKPDRPTPPKRGKSHVGQSLRETAEAVSLAVEIERRARG